MKAIVCETFGPPEDLTRAEIDRPKPGPKQVLIEIHAAGVGFVDGLMIQGLYQVKPKLPYYPGSEFSGVVSEVGSEVIHLNKGERVFGMSSTGAFADYALADASAVHKLPAMSALDDATAAGLPINYATALYGLRDCGDLQGGETVLILGAAGGVGSAAISVAKAMDATVIAGASTEAKRQAAFEFGADAVVDYTQPEWRRELAIAAPSGINVVYDPVGGDLSEPAFRSLSRQGRLLVVGFASGTIPKLALNLALLKRSAIIGVDWGGASRADPAMNQELLTTLIKWSNSGRLKPAPVERRAMTDYVSAFKDQLAGKVIGKLVLQN